MCTHSYGPLRAFPPIALSDLGASMRSAGSGQTQSGSCRPSGTAEPSSRIAAEETRDAPDGQSDAMKGSHDGRKRWRAGGHRRIRDLRSEWFAQQGFSWRGLDRPTSA